MGAVIPLAAARHGNNTVKLKLDRSGKLEAAEAETWSRRSAWVIADGSASTKWALIICQNFSEEAISNWIR